MKKILIAVSIILIPCFLYAGFKRDGVDNLTTTSGKVDGINVGKVDGQEVPAEGGDPYAVYTNDANLQALYRFELSGADIGDDTTTNYDLAQNNGGPDRVQNSQPQGSYNASFNSGDSEYLSGSAISELLSSDYSFGGWFYADSTISDWEGIMSVGGEADGLGFRIKGVSGSYYWNHWRGIDWGGKEVTSATVVAQDTWVHVVVTHKSGEAGNDTFLYVNGNTTPDASADWDDDPDTANPSATYLGYDDGLGNKYFNGDMDEVFFFDRVLSANEVHSIYTSGIQDP